MSTVNNRENKIMIVQEYNVKCKHKANIAFQSGSTMVEASMGMLLIMMNLRGQSPLLVN